MSTRICIRPDCEHGGKPQPEENFNWRRKAQGTRRGECSDCSTRDQKPLNAAHTASELKARWNLHAFYRVLTQPVMGANWDKEGLA